ncbi:MAG: Lrp/AsnC family transcriptional regulator [Candidatus Bathyarchaeia archaeon]
MRKSKTIDTRHIDTQLINLLQEDCRISFIDIAKKLGVSTATVFNHIKNLEERGLVNRYSAVVDSCKLGYGLAVVILMKIDGKHITEVQKEVATFKNVMAVYEVTGDYDVVAICKFRQISELDVFVKNLLAMPNIRRTVTYVILNVAKEDFRIQIET